MCSGHFDFVGNFRRTILKIPDGSGTAALHILILLIFYRIHVKAGSDICGNNSVKILFQFQGIGLGDICQIYSALKCHIDQHIFSKVPDASVCSKSIPIDPEIEFVNIDVCIFSNAGLIHDHGSNGDIFYCFWQVGIFKRSIIGSNIDLHFWNISFIHNSADKAIYHEISAGLYIFNVFRIFFRNYRQEIFKGRGGGFELQVHLIIVLIHLHVTVKSKRQLIYQGFILQEGVAHPFQVHFKIGVQLQLVAVKIIDAVHLKTNKSSGVGA